MGRRLEGQNKGQLKDSSLAILISRRFSVLFFLQSFILDLGAGWLAGKVGIFK